jgi:glycine cleavage system H lipoate-binding protein
MVAALVLITFVAFVAVDYLMQSRRSDEASAQAGQSTAKFEEASRGAPMGAAGGFKLPANLSYHPGHTWAMKEGYQMVRIGLDDLAVRLLGPIDRMELPARGRWLRQGENGWTITRGTHTFNVLSPIEGEVVDVNPAVLKNPSIIHGDPYGAGWLVAVSAPAVDGNMKNLLHGRLAQRWMEESVGALHARLSPGSEAYLQDGGHAIGDVLSLVPESQWDKFVQEMLLG